MFASMRFSRYHILVVGAVAFWGFARPAIADEHLVALGLQVFQKQGACDICHGWAADGEALDYRYGGAPSIRSTALDRDALVLVVKCGRLDTPMPHFDRLAYSDGRCMGLTEAAVGDRKPPAPSTFLSGRQIDAVVSYLEARVIGRGAPIRTECEAYYAPGAGQCQRYP